MDKTKSALTWVKSKAASLWEFVRSLSFKSQASLAVLVSVAALMLLFGAPDRKTVAKALPDYATPADVKTAVAPIQRSLDTLTADLHQLRIELNAVEAKLSEPPQKIETGSIQPKKKRR